MLTPSKLLTHFDPSLPLVLACDASEYGIGAVLAHRMEDGSENPLGYVSRTLTKAEKNYSQLEKELVSLEFADFITTCLGTDSSSSLIISLCWVC